MSEESMMQGFPADQRSEGETLQEWTYRQIRFAIMTGAFAPGNSITMRGLANQLDVSLMPVRESLRRLVAEHALQLLPNRRVAVPAMTAARFDELCATRINLECLAAERALLAVNAEDIACMFSADEAMNQALTRGDVVDAVIQNQRFHARLYTAAPSEVLFPLIENLWLQFGPFVREILERMSADFIAGDYLVDRHTEALRAIEKRDAFALKVAIEADIRDGIGAIGREGLKEGVGLK